MSASQRFNTLMNESPQLRSLLDSVQMLTALQQEFAKVAPPYLAQSVQVLGLRTGMLTIATTNGAFAAKLRQLVPELVAKLQDNGCEISGIKVKVQVSYASVVRPPAPRLLSDTAQIQIQALSQHMKESPLKHALQKLVSANHFNGHEKIRS